MLCNWMFGRWLSPFLRWVLTLTMASKLLMSYALFVMTPNSWFPKVNLSRRGFETGCQRLKVCKAQVVLAWRHPLEVDHEGRNRGGRSDHFQVIETYTYIIIDIYIYIHVSVCMYLQMCTCYHMFIFASPYCKLQAIQLHNDHWRKPPFEGGSMFASVCHSCAHLHLHFATRAAIGYVQVLMWSLFSNDHAWKACLVFICQRSSGIPPTSSQRNHWWTSRRSHLRGRNQQLYLNCKQLLINRWISHCSQGYTKRI